MGVEVRDNVPKAEQLFQASTPSGQLCVPGTAEGYGVSGLGASRDKPIGRERGLRTNVCPAKSSGLPEVLMRATRSSLCLVSALLAACGSVVHEPVSPGSDAGAAGEGSGDARAGGGRACPESGHGQIELDSLPGFASSALVDSGSPAPTSRIDVSILAPMAFWPSTLPVIYGRRMLLLARCSRSPRPTSTSRARARSQPRCSFRSTAHSIWVAPPSTIKARSGFRRPNTVSAN